MKLGLDQPIYIQFGQFLKGIVAGRDYNSGPDVTHCSAPCFGYSFRTEQEVWPLLHRPLPGHLSLALGAAVLWLIFGVAGRRASPRCKRGRSSDRSGDDHRAGRRLAARSTSPACSPADLRLLAGLASAAASTSPSTDDPAGWASKLFLPWITLAFLFAAMYARLTRASMLETLGEDYIRTARAKGLKRAAS